jgi:hypothetical protein
MPRRKGWLSIFGLCPSGGLWPNKSEGLNPNQGLSPPIIWPVSAWQSHRRTSGGKAEPEVAVTSKGKAPAEYDDPRIGLTTRTTGLSLCLLM